MAIEEVIARQREFYGTDATKSPRFRKAALEKLKAAVKENEEGILRALKQDLNKPAVESFVTEVGLVLNELSLAIRNLETWAKPRRVHTPAVLFHARSFVRPEPYGVALIMSPWNFPFQLCMLPLVGAIAAGNCAAIKPSSHAPHTSRIVAEIIRSCFLPEYVAVIEGGRERNAEILQIKFDFIFFTGSVAAGKVVMEAASRNLTPLCLELGGKNPCIVDATADLKAAARRIVYGKFLNAGQSCVAPDYLLVHRSVSEPLVSRMRAEVERSFPGGDYTDMPVIISDRHYNRLMGLMEGRRILFGGGGDPGRRLIEPTAVECVSLDCAIMKEEVFGPLLPVIEYESVEEAIGIVRAGPKPIALYLFTADKAAERRILRDVSFGGGCINDTSIQFVTPHLGFGGVGESGMGRYHGKTSFDLFTHYKSIVRKYNWIDLPIRYRPYTEKAFRAFHFFFK